MQHRFQVWGELTGTVLAASGPWRSAAGACASVCCLKLRSASIRCQRLQKELPGIAPRVRQGIALAIGPLAIGVTRHAHGAHQHIWKTPLHLFPHTPAIRQRLSDGFCPVWLGASRSRSPLSGNTCLPHRKKRYIPSRRHRRVPVRRPPATTSHSQAGGQGSTACVRERKGST